MTNFEKITIIANQLANNGKKPTVAQVKGKLVDPVPLPQIISTLKSWKHEPENCTFPTYRISEDDNDKAVIEGKIVLTQEQLEQSIKQAIDKAIAPLKAELAEINALLRSIKTASK